MDDNTSCAASVAHSCERGDGLGVALTQSPALARGAFIGDGTRTEEPNHEELDSRLAELERKIALAHTSFLARAALTREWADIYAQTKYGHACPKSVGRKPSIVGVIVNAMTERLHPLTKGKSKEALRKVIQRDLEIAYLGQDVIEAATAAGLANCQRHLRKVAKAGTTPAQLDEIKALKKCKDEAAAKKSASRKQAAGKVQAVLRIPRDRQTEVLHKLAEFVEENGIELVEPEARAA